MYCNNIKLTTEQGQGPRSQTLTFRAKKKKAKLKDPQRNHVSDFHTRGLSRGDIVGQIQPFI